MCEVKITGATLPRTVARFCFRRILQGTQGPGNAVQFNCVGKAHFAGAPLVATAEPQVSLKLAVASLQPMAQEWVQCTPFPEVLQTHCTSSKYVRQVWSVRHQLQQKGLTM